MERRPGVVILEGWDCCGKTSVANSLSNAVDNSYYYHSPRGVGKFSGDVYDIIKANLPLVDASTMRALQLAMNIYNLQQIWERVEAGYWVIADRGILSTVAYQKMSIADLESAVHSLTDDVQIRAKVLGGYRVNQTYHLNPEYCFLLTNSLPVLKSRQKGRDQHDEWDDYALQNITYLMNTYKDNFREVYPLAKHKVIDTDPLTQLEVSEIVLDTLRIY